MNTKPTASCGCGKPRTTPISPEEKRWLKEKLYQSQYDEFMQEHREAWLFLRPGHRRSYRQEVLYCPRKHRLLSPKGSLSGRIPETLYL